MNYGLHKRGKHYHYYFRLRGKRYRGSTYTGYKDLALEYARSVYERIYTGDIRKDITVSDLIIYHIDNTSKGLAEKYIKDKRTDLNQFLDFISSKEVKYIRNIDLELVEEYRTYLLGKNNPKTVKNKIANISKMFRHALRLRYIEINPCSNLEPIRGILKCKPRFLSREEIAIVLDAVKSTSLELPVRVGLYTGMRRSEICNLHYEDIDFEKKLVYAKHRDGFKTKSRKERVIPLHLELEKALGKRKKGKVSAVFVDWFSERFNTLMDDLGLEDVTVHTLRHTFASHLAMQGVPLFLIANWLGHSTTHITELYAHLCPKDPGRAEIEKLSF